MSQLEPMMTSGPLPPSRHRSTAATWVIGLLAVGLAVAMLVLSLNLVHGPAETTDYAGGGTGEVTVVVSRGDTLTEIGTKLEAAGVVLSSDSFVNAAAVDDRSGTIGPGKYTLRRQMSSIAALELMLDPASRADSRLVLPEGLRLEQTVNVAAEATNLPKSAFQDALQEPASLDLPAWAKDRPEGFMFPASYDLTGEETAKATLRQLVKRFKQSSADIGLEERAAAVGLSPYEALIVASLLQAEASPQDFSKVARVIYNRLDEGMPLQLDSTVSYALGITDIQLNEEQLKTSSPYNTYLRRGLPPRPINSPGEAAMEAALTPAKGKWLYFVSVDPRTSETKFARTYDKFLELKAEFQRNLATYEEEQAQAQQDGQQDGNG